MEEHYKAYRKLRKTIDEKAAKLEGMHKRHMMCKAGCDLCCMDYSVFPIEFYHIKQKLKALNQTPETNEDAGEADCIFLKEHKCTIYSERPIICRTHGLPLLYMGNDNAWELSACELNFTEFEMEKFDDKNTFPQDTFNSKLYLLNKAFIKEFKETEHKEMELIPLKRLKDFLTP